MYILLFLFFLQTACFSVYYSLIPQGLVAILPAEFFQGVQSLKTSGLYQLINITLLAGTFFCYPKRLNTIIYCLRSYRSVTMTILVAIYLGLISLYLGIFLEDFLYYYWLHLVVGLWVFLFPYAFVEPVVRNPMGLKEDSYNFSLLAENGQTLPISSPQTGIYIVGSAGSGKTVSLIEPIIYQMIKKGYSGIVYDYDFSPRPVAETRSLTHVAYQSLQLCASKDDKRRFISINFQDLTTSARINPIHPSHIQDRKQLSHTLNILLLNLNPALAQRDDFWYKNSYSLLKSIVIFLSNRYPSYCTLPHAILLGLQDQERLLTLLDQEEEAALCASPILDAFRNGPEQLAGVMANFKVLLERLVDKDIFWVLSDNQVPLRVNDPINPLIICLGNTPGQQGGIAPVLSMITATLIEAMYGHNREKSFVLIDELPTMVLPNLSQVPATARKYKIATVVALQTPSQLKASYGDVGAETIRDTFSNHFIGRGPYSVSKEMSDMMGKRSVESISTTKSASQAESKTIHHKEEDLIDPQEGMTLKTGDFRGYIVHPKGGLFKIRLLPLQAYHKQLAPYCFQSLPICQNTIDVTENFNQIQKQVKDMVKADF